jgi:plastocyanin
MLARRRAVVVCAAILTAAPLAACASKAPINRPGNSGSAAASLVNGVQQVTLTTGDDYRFHPATFSVHPGKVKVILHNKGTGAPHDVQVTGFPADFVPLASAGQTQEATFTAPPVQNGEATKYQFVCTIHVRQGQVGTMIVTPG